MAARTVSMLDVESEVKVRKKGSRKISAPPWLKGRLIGSKTTKGHKTGPVPCCGVDVAGDVGTIAEERQYEDKSVQCDDLLPDNGHRYGFHRNSTERCASCCHPTNPIYQTNVIVNQIPFMDDEPDDVSLPTFRRSHHPVRHRRHSRLDAAAPPSQALFRKNNLLAIAALENGEASSPGNAFRHSSYIAEHSDSQDCGTSWSQSDVSIPNTIEYDLNTVEPARPRVPLRRRTGAYGNVTLNVQIANGINTAILEGDAERPVAPRRRHGVVPDRAAVRESCQESQSQSSSLVLGINSDARSPLNYKMYTPFYNKRQTMPPEHFKNWPSESRYADEGEHSYRTLSYYSEVANQLEQYERRSFDAGSSCMLNAIDSNSIMYRSSIDNLPKVEEKSVLDNRKQLRMRRNGTTDAELIPSGVGKTVTAPVCQPGSRQARHGAEFRAKNKPSDQIPAQTQSNLLAPPTSTFGRWSGSIQNLFSIGNRTSNGTGRWSKSENCLNEVGQRQRNGSTKPADSRLLWSDRLFGRSTAAGRAGKHGRARRTNTFLTSGGGSFFTYKYDDEEESAWSKYFSLGMLRKMRSKQGKPSKGKDGRLVPEN
uniref:Uncharacterized protein n=1 Tax=Anopheles epiroticus TaxID=199890 RepID=A0A182PAH7_9DIPT